MDLSKQNWCSFPLSCMLWVCCLLLSVLYVCMLVEARRLCWIPWDWSCRWSWAMWVLGREHRSTTRATRVLDHGAISPVSKLEKRNRRNSPNTLKDTKYFLLNIFLKVDNEIPSKTLVNRTFLSHVLWFSYSFVAVKPPPCLPLVSWVGGPVNLLAGKLIHPWCFQVCGLWQTKLLRCVYGWLPRRRLGKPWQEGSGVSHTGHPEDAFEGFALVGPPLLLSHTFNVNSQLSEPVVQDSQAFGVMYLELNLLSYTFPAWPWWGFLGFPMISSGQSELPNCSQVIKRLNEGI